jgi:hypothetical protein
MLANEKIMVEKSSASVNAERPFTNSGLLFLVLLICRWKDLLDPRVQPRVSRLQ